MGTSLKSSLARQPPLLRLTAYYTGRAIRVCVIEGTRLLLLDKWKSYACDVIQTEGDPARC